MAQYAIILSVNPDKWSPEEEICKHFRHLVKNGTVEWGTRSIRNKKIHEQNKMKPFYAYAYIPKKGIKYRFLVERFITKDVRQKTIRPFKDKNVPKHYFEKEKNPTSESWLKIKKIEKINPPLLVTHFKSWDGKPVKKEFVQGRIYVLEPLKTSISTECDCPLDDGEVTMNPEKKDVYIKSRQHPSKIPIKNRDELRRSFIGGMGAEREKDEETTELIAERTEAHQEILMIFFDQYDKRGMQVFRSINYDLLVEKEDIALLHEMKTLTEENERDQIMKGIGQLFYYENFTLQQNLENHNAQVVKAIVFQKSLTYSPHIEFIKSLGIHVFWIGDDSRIEGEAESMAFLRGFLGMD